MRLYMECERCAHRVDTEVGEKPDKFVIVDAAKRLVPLFLPHAKGHIRAYLWVEGLEDSRAIIVIEPDLSRWAI